MNKEWVLDVKDESLPKSVKDEIFKMVRGQYLSDESVILLSIKMLKDGDESSWPALIKFLEDQNLSDDEKVYVYISW